MKHVWMTLFIALTPATAFAGEAGRVVPQVIETLPPTIGPISVNMGESLPVAIPDTIAGVSIGSSRIANVAVHDANTLLITGRSYGGTSLHVFDPLGNVVVNTTVNVVDGSTTRLRVNRAGSDYSMQCAGSCQAAPHVGDNSEYFESVTEQAQMLSE